MSEQRARAYRAYLAQKSDEMSLGKDAALGIFALVDLLNENPKFATIMTSPVVSDESRKAIAETLFAGKLVPEVVSYFWQAAALDWSSGSELAAELEYQSVRALLNTAKATDSLDQVRTDLQAVSDLSETNRKFNDVMSLNSVPNGALPKLLDQMFGDQINPISMILLKRASIVQDTTFSEVVDAYLVVASEVRGRRLARVKTAVPMSDVQMARLVKELARIYGQVFDLDARVTPEVLGGVQVRVDDEMFDGTIRGRLVEARRVLDEK